jgi:hypothetical protein
MSDTEDAIVTRAIRNQAQRESQRAIFETHWREVAEICLPRQDIFWRRGMIPQGEKRTYRQFDSTAELALSRFVAAMVSMLIPRTQEWHKLIPEDPDLLEDEASTEYLDRLTKLLFKLRYDARANYQSEKSEVFSSVGAFGTGVLFVDEDIGRNFRYRSCHLSEVFLAESHTGIIDSVYRKFPMTVRQIAQKWGADNVPTQMKNALANSPETEFDILHCVEPNEDYQTGKSTFRGMKFSSYYISIVGRKLLSQGGYRTMPYSIDRYVTGPREVYGRGPGMLSLADNRMLQEMSKTVIRAAHKEVDPPLLLQEDGALQAFDLRPGALNYGGVDEKGQQLVHPLVTNARIDIGLEMQEQRRKAINDTFLVSLFQILVENPQMTATEAMLRAQEKGALLAPTMSRAQEALGVQIEREIDLAFQAGLLNSLGPPPKALMEAGGSFKIEYSSPLNRLMRAEEGVGILQLISDTLNLAQLDPSVVHLIDAEEAIRQLQGIRGAPPKIVRSPEAVQALKDQAAQQQQLAQMVAAAPQIAGAAKDLSSAVATGQNVPQPQPGQGA